MANATYDIKQRFSSLASDPLRGFRFYAEFKAVDTPFSTKITTPNTTTQANGTTGSSMAPGFIGGFTQVSGLQVNVQDIPYREGGYNVTAHHLPGMVTYTPVIFQRGVLFGNDQAMTWLNAMIDVTSAGTTDGLGERGSLTGQPAGNYRVDVNIYLADHPNTANKLVPRMGWTIHNAWVTNVSYTDLNSVANEVEFETMTLVHEGMEVFFTNADGTKAAGSGSAKAQ